MLLQLLDDFGALYGGWRIDICTLNLLHPDIMSGCTSNLMTRCLWTLQVGFRQPITRPGKCKVQEQKTNDG